MIWELTQYDHNPTFSINVDGHENDSSQVPDNHDFAKAERKTDARPTSQKG
jgi:hypothetical protein